MKILFLTHYAALYGANRSLIDLLNGLKKYQIIPFLIVTESGPLTEYCGKNNIRYYIVPFKTGVEYRWKSKNWVNQFMRDVQYFAISCYKYVVNRKYTNEIAIIAKKESIDLIYSNSSVLTIGHFISKKLNKPQIFHIRELIIEQFSLYPDFGTNYYKKLVSKLTHQIFISQYVKNKCLTGNMNENYSILYDGVSITSLRRIKSKIEPLSIGVIGYLCRQKNQIEVLKALRLMNNDHVKLVLIGGGDIDHFKEKSIELGIESKVVFTGFQNDIDSYYSKLDVVVVPSINEALGRVTIEAMMYGIPVIGKNSGATLELIENGITGLIYNNEQDLANKIESLISDPHYRLQMGTTAQLRARDTFNLDAYSEKIFGIIRNCMG